MSIQTICLRLRSEKIRERKDGRKELSDLLDRDRTEECVPLRYGQELLVAALLYEKNEINHVKANNELAADETSKKTWKAVDTQIAVWVRSLIKHFILTGQKHFQGIWSFKKWPAFKVVVEHTLEVLQDQDEALPESYRTHHKQLLCDVLDFRVSHSFSYDPTVQNAIFTYLRDTLVVDEKGISEALHQRMLRAFSKTLFSDEENILVIIKMFLEWLCDEEAILRIVRGDDKMGADAVMTLADCCATLLDYHGVTLIEKMYSCCRGVLLAVAYHLPRQKSRDTHRDSYLRFLYIFLKVGMQAQVDLHSVFHPNNPLVETTSKPSGERGPAILAELCDSLFSDEFLRSVVVTGTNATVLKQSRDAFHSPQDEPRLRLYFDVVALTVGLHELHGKSSRKALSSASTSTTIGMSAGRDPGSSDLEPGVAEVLLHRIATFDFAFQHSASTARTASPLPFAESQAASASSSSSSSASSFAPSLHTQQVPQQSGGGGVGAGRVSVAIPKASALLFEGLLLSLQALIRQFPRGECLVFCCPPVGTYGAQMPGSGLEGSSAQELGPAAFRSTRCRLTVVTWLLGALRERLLECLGLLSNRQMLGALLNTFTSLAALTRQLLDQNDPPAIVLEPLQAQWAQLMHLLLQDTRLQPYSQVCKRRSVTECYVTTLLAMLEFRVLAPAQQWNLLHMLWQVPPVSNPRTVESASFLHLLTSMMRYAEHDIPSLLLHNCGTSAHSVSAGAAGIDIGMGTIGADGMSMGLSASASMSNSDAALLSLTQDDAPLLLGEDPSLANSDKGALRCLHLFESKSGVAPSSVQGSMQGVLYAMCWLEAQLVAPVNARMTLGSFPDAAAALTGLISLAIPDNPQRGKYLSLAPNADASAAPVTTSSSSSKSNGSAKPAIVPDLLRVASEGDNTFFSSGKEASRSKDKSKGKRGLTASSLSPTTHDTRIASIGSLSLLRKQLPSSDFRNTYHPVGTVPLLSGDIADSALALSASAIDNGGGLMVPDLAVGGLEGPLLGFMGDGAVAGSDEKGCDDDDDDDDDYANPVLAPVRDAERKAQEHKTANESFFSHVESALTMLQVVADMLLDNTSMNVQLTDASDRVTQWQVVGLFLCSCIASLAMDVERKKCERSHRFCQGVLREIQLAMAECFWSVVGAQIYVLRARLHLMRWSVSGEFLTHLATVVKTVNPIHAFCTQKRTGIYKGCSSRRAEVCEKLFEVMLVVRDLSIPGLGLDQGGMGVAAGGGGSGSSELGGVFSVQSNADQPSSGNGSTASKKRPRGVGITFDDDEEFGLTDSIKLPKTHSSSSSSAAKSSNVSGDATQEHDDDGSVGEGQGAGGRAAAPLRVKLALAGDKQRVFIAAAAIFVIAAFDSNETLLSVFDVVRSRAASGSVSGVPATADSPSRAGSGGGRSMRNRELILTVNSDFFLNLAEVMSTVQSTNTVYQCLVSPGAEVKVAWDREWGPLGYYQVLGVVNNLLSRPFFFMCSMSSGEEGQPNPRAMILDHLFAIAAGDKSMRRYTPHYWRIRYMQLLCLSHFIESNRQVVDEPDCYKVKDEKRKRLLWDFFLSRTEDPHVQVRLLAVSKLHLIINYFGNRDRIFAKIAGSSPQALMVRVRSDIQAIGGSSLGDNNAQRAAFAVTNVVAIAQLGVHGADASTVCRALLAIITVCHLHYLAAAGSGSQRYSPSFQSLLHRVVESMARSLGYACTADFTADHFRWVLFAWMDSLGLPLVDFPLWLFRPRSSHVDSPPRGKPKSVWEGTAAMLLEHRDAVVSTIAVLRDPARRIEGMKAFCTMCGYTSGDNEIARFLHHSFPSLKALEISLANVRDFSPVAYKDGNGNGNGSGSRDSAGTDRSDINDELIPPSFRFVDEAAESSAQLHAFLQFVSDDVVTSMSALWVSDVVREFFVGLTYTPAAPGEPMMWAEHDLLSPPPPYIAKLFEGTLTPTDMSRVHGGPSKRSLPTLQLHLLKGLHEIIGNFVYQIEAQVAEPDYCVPLSRRLQTLFRQHCNWIEILSALHARLCATRAEKAQIAALMVVEVVFTNMVFLPMEKGRTQHRSRAPDRLPLPTWDGLLDVVVLVLRRAATTRVVVEGCRVLDVMARRVLAEVYEQEEPWKSLAAQAGMTQGTQTEKYFHSLLLDLLPTLMSIVQALQMCRYRSEVYHRHADTIRMLEETEEEAPDTEQERELKQKQDNAMEVVAAGGEEDDWFTSDSFPRQQGSSSSRGDGARSSAAKRSIGLADVQEVPRDRFVEEAFAELTELSPESDQQRMGLDQKLAYASWRGNVDKALSMASSLLESYFAADSQSVGLASFSIAQALYPLPEALLASLTLTGEIPAATEVRFDHRHRAYMSAEPRAKLLERRMQEWVGQARIALQGERCSWLALWHSLGGIAALLGLEPADADTTISPSDGSRSSSSGGHAALEGEMGLESPWSMFPELTGRFVSTLSSLSPPSGSGACNGAVQVWKSKVMSVIGHLGAPDLMSLSHHNLPSKEKDTLTLCNSSIPALKAMIVGRLGGLLWVEDPCLHCLASAALRYCANAPEKPNHGVGSRAASAGTALTTVSAFKSHRHNCLNDPEVESIAPKTGKYAAALLETYTTVASNDSPGAFRTLYPPNNAAEQQRASASSSFSNTIWDKTVWKTQGKTYEEWVTKLASAVLRSCQPRVAVGSARKPSSGVVAISSSSTSGGSNSDEGFSSHYSFLASLVDVCERSASVAEAVLPMALFEAVKARGAEHNNVSSFLTRYVLSEACTLKLATRLGCAILVFFLRQEVDSFKCRSRTSQLTQAETKITGASGETKSGRGTSGGARKEASKSQQAARDSSGVQLYSYSLNVDLLFAAQAAARCGCVCTSLVFAELAHEHRQTGLFSEGKGRPEEGDDRRGESAALLVQIFQQAHDPDALFGMLKEGTSCFSGRAALAIQAEFYAHTGSWMEALATYESLLQCDETDGGAGPGLGAGGSGRRAGRTSGGAAAGWGGNAAFLSGLGTPQQGVSKALRGLGFQHVLSRYSDASGRPGTEAPRVENSQLAWRNVDLDVLLSQAQAQTSSSPSSAPAGTVTALQSARSQADSHLRRWPAPPDLGRNSSDLSADALRHGTGAAGSHHRIHSMIDAPFGGRIFSGTTTTTTSGGGDDDTELALYFDTTMGSCLKDLARGVPLAAKRRAARVARALMTKIDTCMYQESAFSLVPSIVRAQQLLETRETAELLDYADYAAAAAADTSGSNSSRRLARSELCLAKWRTRLAGGPAAGNNEGSNLNEGILSLRISLVTQLLRTGNASACQAVLLGGQINDVIPSGAAGRGVVHAMSPLVYRLHTAIARVATTGLLTVGVDNGSSSRSSSGGGGGGGFEVASDTEMDTATEVPHPPRKFGKGSSSSSSSSSSTSLAPLPTMSPSRLWQADWTLQECKLLWRKGLDKVALRSLDDNVIAVLRGALERWPGSASGNGGADRSSYRLYDRKYVSNLMSEALRLGGEWMGEKKAAMGSDILTDYLSGAVEAAKGQEERIRAEMTYADFNDKLYHALLARMTSPEHQHLERVMRDRKQEYDRSYTIYQSWSQRERNDESLKEEYKSLSRHLNSLRKEVEGDRKARDESRESLRTYLKHALCGYRRVLGLSEGADLEVVFKAVNLWMNQKDEKGVNDEMTAIIRGTCSFKFVPLAYQMISLLGSQSQLADHEEASGDATGTGTGTGASFDRFSLRDTSSQALSLEDRAAEDRRFQEMLTELVYRLCKEHPFHCLPQLFALVNKDETGAGSLAVFRAKLDKSRYEVADAILRDLRDTKKVGPALANLVADTDVLLKHYVNLAMIKVDDYVDNPRSAISFGDIPGLGVTAKNKLGTPFDRCMGAMKGRPAVLTLTPPLQKDGRYHHQDYSLDPAQPSSSAAYTESPVVHMSSVENDFNITESGISVPKVIKVEGSDGVVYKQLVKGNDDMRQDAVMEQVFALVNDTLSKNEETRKRQLRIRTYKCVPCTPQTGVIEWVEGCRPLGDFLLHKETGLHARYYPHDWTTSQCRQHMNAMKDAEPREKEQALREVYEKFHPAFRFRFIELYPDPSQWLSCRLTYTRSVAVNSMVGYILAIGDRHSNNILVDQTSSEVVHIDFGIVFDQGKLLPTPETVPFRLTRDVIDGMGITGVEGTFRRSCEQVLRVIRDNAGQVLTICEVVVHDPLYKWSLSPLEARKKQEESKGGKGKRGSAAGDRVEKSGAHSGKDTGAPSDGGGVNAASNAGRTKGGRQAAADVSSGAAGGDDAQQDRPDGGLAGHQAHRDAARRMLMTLKSKLQGYENPAGEVLGVEGHVEALISSATDVRNLCKLFSGWAAWV